MDWTQRCKTINTRAQFLPNIVHESVSGHISFVKIIHPTTNVWQIKTLIRQHEFCTGVHLEVHNKNTLTLKCSCFAFLGWHGRVQKNSIWCDHLVPHNTSPSVEVIRLLIVACGCDPLLFNDWIWWILAGTEHAVIYGNLEHLKHAPWVTSLVSRLAIQELRHFQLPEIVFRSWQHIQAANGSNNTDWFSDPPVLSWKEKF